jgi:hypothetical protein
LAGQHAFNRAADAFIDVGINPKCLALRKLIHIEKRQGPAHDLLRTAVRIAIECLKDSRNIYSCKRGHGKRYGARAGYEISKNVVRKS